MEEFALTLTTIIVLILFFMGLIWKRNNLALLEIMTIGAFVSTINQNFIDIVSANLKLIHITEQQQMFWSSLLISSFLSPLVIILFIDYYSESRTSLQKLCLFLIWVMLLTGIDYMAKFVGIVHFHNWRFWWSFLEWISILIAALYCRRFLYYLYAKGKSKKWSLHRQ